MYSIEDERAFLLGDLGYRFDLAADSASAQKVGGLGTSAHAFLGTAVRCLLVGFDEPSTRLVEKAEQWLISAIETNEKPRHYFEFATEASRLQDLAISRWLLRDEHDATSLDGFAQFQDEYWRKSRGATDKVSVSLTLVGYLDAGALTRVIELVLGTSASSVAAASVRAETETDVALWVARGRVDHNADTPEVGEQLLRKHGLRWLSEGHYLRFAEWIKVLRWTPGTHKAAKALLIEALSRIQL